MLKSVRTSCQKNILIIRFNLSLLDEKSLVYMMAGIFLVFVGAILAVYWRQRTLAISLILLALGLTLLVFWHHVTTTININL